jgi:hypothetical protein
LVVVTPRYQSRKLKSFPTMDGVGGTTSISRAARVDHGGDGDPRAGPLQLLRVEGDRLPVAAGGGPAHGRDHRRAFGVGPDQLGQPVHLLVDLYGLRQRDGDLLVLLEEPPGVHDGDAHEVASGVIAQGVAFRRLLELDRGGGISNMEVQDVGIAVVHDVVEFQVPMDDRHG